MTNIRYEMMLMRTGEVPFTHDRQQSSVKMMLTRMILILLTQIQASCQAVSLPPFLWTKLGFIIKTPSPSLCEILLEELPKRIRNKSKQQYDSDDLRRLVYRNSIDHPHDEKSSRLG